jgi:hypothetical protein
MFLTFFNESADVFDSLIVVDEKLFAIIKECFYFLTEKLKKGKRKSKKNCHWKMLSHEIIWLSTFACFSISVV